MTAFRTLLDQAVARGLTPEQAYDAAVAEVGAAQLAEHFRPVGISEARDLLRQQTRRIENRVFGRTGGRRLEIIETPPRPAVDIRSILLGRTFTAGDRVVTWGSATAEDHERRAAEQESRAADLLTDADRHRRAAKLLRQHDAAGLDDLDDEDLDDLLDGLEQETGS